MLLILAAGACMNAISLDNKSTDNTSADSKIIGRIIEIHGPVVDVAVSYPPPIHQALVAETEGQRYVLGGLSAS